MLVLTLFDVVVVIVVGVVVAAAVKETCFVRQDSASSVLFHLPFSAYQVELFSIGGINVLHCTIDCLSIDLLDFHTF